MAAYDDNMGPPAETMSEGMHEDTPPGADAGGADMHAGGESSLFLTPDMLPPGMKLNAGDILEFKVINPSDQDGHIEVVYNTGEGGGGEEKSEDWENDLRHEMSAQNPGDGGQTNESGAGGY